LLVSNDANATFAAEAYISTMWYRGFYLLDNARAKMSRGPKALSSS